MHEKFKQKLAGLVDRFEYLGKQMASPDTVDDYAAVSKEYSELQPIVELIKQHEAALAEQADLQEMLDDPEMKAMAEDDLRSLAVLIPKLEQKIQIALLPKDEADEKNAILEVRAGTGGDEAGLFAAELFRMYQRYAESKGWKFEPMNISETGVGGYKEATASISGKGVFARLKYESGVHRVQRVPVTESGGRIHTSAATVAVLPEAEEVDVEIKDSDIRIDVFRASGPGGQSVNTTDSAVRITHIPTGIVVSQQDQKSQHKNKEKAMRVLRARIYDMQRQKAEAERSAERRGQVGSGDRSERIRTYNFPQGRVTDHRINKTTHNIEAVLSGEGLDEYIDALRAVDEAERLAAVTEEMAADGAAQKK